MNLKERLKSKGPKRILTLDGGGIRGALTLGYLERIEEILQDRHKNPELRLCDYFDLIGGTSTGSIIAAGLAIGMSATEVKEMYLNLGGKVFSRNKFWKLLKAYFDARHLKKELKNVFGDTLLGDGEKIKTGLCIFAKRADTGSIWTLINHPEGKYFPALKNILLRQAVRASTAAPTYFIPEEISIGHEEKGVFIDGGVSMVNNPALMMFLMVTSQGFPYKWELGEDDIFLVSIGTGVWSLRNEVRKVKKSWLKDWASKVPQMLMDDANWQNQLILQSLSNTKTPWQIDRMFGDLAPDLITKEPALSYLRYNAWLDENGMNELGLTDLKSKVKSLRDMSAGENRFDLAKVGEKSSEIQIKGEHFPPTFNL